MASRVDIQIVKGSKRKKLEDAAIEKREQKLLSVNRKENFSGKSLSTRSDKIPTKKVKAVLKL